MSALGSADQATRAHVVTQLQRWHGNSQVQRVLRGDPAEFGEKDEIGQRIQAAAGGGSGLDDVVQRRLEVGLGADLSGVRVHTDRDADQLARSVNAVAFTSGADIFFQAGAYDPSSTTGMRVLAHEAAHTVQQAQGPVDGTPTAAGVAISDPGDRFERAADAAAHTLTGDGSGAGSVATVGSTPVQRQEAPAEDEEQPQKPDEEQAAAG
ncbi:MAG: DUF4157 domain-containing protein [Chloroflexi bacterium]|nr:DUF4157 domain-containing protein [Chloroflexota bacterium]